MHVLYGSINYNVISVISVISKPNHEVLAAKQGRSRPLLS